jgi:hypothetical protein
MLVDASALAIHVQHPWAYDLGILVYGLSRNRFNTPLGSTTTYMCSNPWFCWFQGVDT